MILHSRAIFKNTFFFFKGITFDSDGSPILYIESNYRFTFFLSVPTKPLNLSSHGITSTTIELSWAEPESANGIISGYRIYYMHSNYTDVQMYKTDEDDGSIIEFVLNELGK